MYTCVLVLPECVSIPAVARHRQIYYQETASICLLPLHAIHPYKPVTKIGRIGKIVACCTPDVRLHVQVARLLNLAM